MLLCYYRDRLKQKSMRTLQTTGLTKEKKVPSAPHEHEPNNTTSVNQVEMSKDDKHEKFNRL